MFKCVYVGVNECMRFEHEDKRDRKKHRLKWQFEEERRQNETKDPNFYDRIYYHLSKPSQCSGMNFGRMENVPVVTRWNHATRYYKQNK